MSIDDFKKYASGVKETLSNLRPGIEDVLTKGQILSQKDFERVEKVAKAIERFRGKQGANEVFSEFGQDAAQGKVMEMYVGETSGDRQRAQETILAYHLGKPVERTFNLNAQIGNMEKNELISKILETVNQIGINVGIEGGVGKTSSLIIPSEEPSGRESPSELPSPSAETGDTAHSVLSGEILEKSEEN